MYSRRSGPREPGRRRQVLNAVRLSERCRRPLTHVLCPCSLALVVVTFVSLASTVEAQTLRGRLLDDATGTGIQAATVLLLASQDSAIDRTVTGVDGSFELSVPGSGWYRLRAQRIGYAMATSPPLNLVRFSSLVIEFRLSVTAVELPPITIVESEPAARPDPRLIRRGFYERQAFYGRSGLGFGYFLEGPELDYSAFVVSDLLRDLPGIRVRAGGGRRMTMTCRSGATPTLYVDGARFPAGIDNASFPVSSITAIEVYPGMVGPSDYDPRGCVVGIWTGIREQREDF